MGTIVAVQGGALVEALPKDRATALAQLRAPLASLRRLERTAREVREMTELPTAQPEPARVAVLDRGSELVGLARDWAGSVASLLGTAGLVIVLLVFILIEREGLRDRVIRVLAADDYHVTTSAFADAVDRVTRYLRALALVNLGHGALVAIGLLAIGLPGALLFGLLAATLRFVPYLGPWVAASLPIALALLTSGGWTLPLQVGLLFIGIELLSNNLLEPRLIGPSVGLSPFAVILSMVFWGWLWGPVGLVLAAPITASLVAFGRYVPSLEPLAILLSDTAALPPAERLYQRLLARDSHEATELVAERTAALGALEAWDDVVLPALRRLEWDRRRGRLDPEQLDVAREALEVVLAELPAPEETEPRRGLVLCLPARGPWDEIVCAALARFLAAAGLSARAVGHGFSAELAEEVARADLDAVCISSLASSAGAAYQLVMRIRKRSPETRIVVGLWGQGDDSKFRKRIAAEPGSYVVERLAEVAPRLLGSVPLAKTAT
jgi:predicted PurR-regulated permease PerM